MTRYSRGSTGLGGGRLAYIYRVLLIRQPQKKNSFVLFFSGQSRTPSLWLWECIYGRPELSSSASSSSSLELSQSLFTNPAVSLSKAGNSDQTFLSILPRSLSPCEAVAGMRPPKAMLFGGWKEINRKGTFQLCEISTCHEHREWEF